jgi:putative DNA primase/helicase
VTTSEILSRLEGVRKNEHFHVARCPAHEDRNPSLSVREGDDGRVLLKCFAGCDTTAIVRALGLPMSALFPTEMRRSAGKASLHRSAGAMASMPHAARRIVATYDYTDEDDEPLFQKVRYEPKGFMQRKRNGGSRWTYRLGDVRRVLYGLSQIIEAVSLGKTIWLVESEKSVERLRDAGLAATCASEGAGTWRKEYSETLRGADVVILPDNDEAGMRHAALVAAQLRGVARSVRVVGL